MESLNFGDERPVNIMDCRKYGCLVGCLLQNHRYVICSSWNVGVYTLNGLLIGGSSLLHMIPWTQECPLRSQSLRIHGLPASSFD